MEQVHKAILVNQLQILKILDPANAADYESQIEILWSGYSILYSDVIGSPEREMSEDDCRFVIDVLTLYRGIEDFKSQYPDDHDVHNHRLSHFLGFDGNNEGRAYGFTKFMIERKNMFQEQRQYHVRPDAFNSHMPMMPTYARLVAAWKRMGTPYPLSKEDVMAILSET